MGSVYATKQNSCFANDGKPGDKYSGIIVFQIPQQAQPESLTYDELTNENKAVINL